MKRIAALLVLLAISIGVPVGWLVVRALEAEAFQREVRHEAIARRVFDEMERALSELLEREEQRPFEAYRSADARSGGKNDEALAASGPVLAYFQRAPDGRIATPGPAATQLEWETARRSIETTLDRARRRRSAAGRAAAPAEILGPALQARIHAEEWESLETGGYGADVAPSLTEGRTVAHAVPDAASEPALPSPAPSLEQLRREDDDAFFFADDAPVVDALQAKKAKPSADFRDQDTYAALDRLNLGSQKRATRKQQVAELSADTLRQYSLEDLSQAGSSDAAEPAAKMKARRGAEMAKAPSDPWLDDEAASGFAQASRPAMREAMPAPSRARASRPASRAEAPPSSAASPARLAPSPPREDGARADRRVQVLLDPMMGRSTEDGRLLLYRTVFVGGEAFRQGLLLEPAGLGDWLRARVLQPAGLSQIATASFGLAGASIDPPAQRDASGYRYQHAFAEPFDALQVTLALAPLPVAGATGTIRLLAALLSLLGAAGLFAVYRMVSVVVHFAERRNNFVASVTHELKTPLTAIRMYAEMLRDGLVRDDGKRQEYYATIGDESERLSRLIDNVLEFSKLEKGQREVHLHAGALRPVVEEVCETLRPHAERHGFSLRVEAHEGLPPVRFDRDALVQVIFNLVDNAMKYARSAERKEVVLSITRSGDAIALRVRDFGPGVPGRQLARIFEPFYRGGSELTRNTQGTGIGLSLVKELGEHMGARVSGRNAEDGGFEVALAFEPAGG